MADQHGEHHAPSRRLSRRPPRHRRRAPSPARWRPAPIQGATEPSDVIAHSAASDWRPIDPENLLVMDLADGGNA